jgi:DNA-directed RNA polymerase
MLAYVSVRSIMNAPKNGVNVTNLAHTIGKLVESECRLDAFEKANKGKLRLWMEDLNQRTNSPEWKRTVLVFKLNKEGDSWSAWDKRTCIRIGMALIDRVLESQDIAEMVQARVGQKTIARVQLTCEARAWITNADNYRALMSPWFLPCVVPPKPWDGLVGGGYWSGMTPKPLRLIKSRRESYEGDPARLGPVLEAVNVLQGTGWKVNARVLALLTEVWVHGLDLPVLPPKEPLPLPPKPFDINVNEVTRTAWKREATKVYEHNATTIHKRMAVANTLNVAQMFKDEAAIYMPYQLDFRGRIYAVPMWLNPQGPDYARALLTFAEGKPIGDTTGPGWLAIHGANCFGVDKVSLLDRISWVEEHEDDIEAVTSDPLQNLWWTEADKPWQFFAFCCEWAEYRRSVKAGNGAGYVSHLPVMVDGTCNGLQHYSAMLRDPVGGAATNLVPASTPSDIYGLVAQAVKRRLLLDRESEFAVGWLAFNIDRKITKRPVMVLPYGGTQHSCREYVYDAIVERGGSPFPVEKQREANMYLAQQVWGSIGDVVVAAREGMAWLRKVAQLLAKHNIAAKWVTPCGFTVEQCYPNERARQMELKLFGTVFRPLVYEEVPGIDSRRSANGLPPNFIHSLDASALINTINLCVANDVVSIAAVHDSYGTHAATMDLLSSCLRYSFVEQYTDHDTLLEFRDWVLEVLPETERVKVPPLPRRGTLDLQLVLESDFFFA